jgi:putative membrane protein
MDEGQLRDQLAVERTRLANERTLLAYIRTALALAAGGAVLLRFFPDLPGLLGVGWVLVVGGAATGFIGGCRFLAIRRRLRDRV